MNENDCASRETALEDVLELQQGRGETAWGKEAAESDLAAFIAQKLERDGNVVVWFDDCIVWGTYRDGEIFLADESALHPPYVQEMRIFNREEELYLRKSRGFFLWRYRKDGDGGEIEYVDCLSRLWGKAERKENAPAGYVLLEDRQRKIALTIPAGELCAPYYGLVTRNYIEYDNETGQAGYGDYRFVAIEPAGRGL